MRNRSRGMLRLPLAVLCAVVGALAFAASPAMALNVHTFSSSFSTGLVPPLDKVDTDSSGDVYVMNSGNSSLDKFDGTGAPVNYSSLGSNQLPIGGGSATSDIAVDKSGGATNGHILSVVEFGAVQVFNADGSMAFALSSGNFSDTCGAAIDSSGNLYVEDFNNGIQKFSPTGTFITSIPVTGSCDIAVDGAGNIYAQQFGGPVFKYDSSGNILNGGNPFDPNTATTVNYDPATNHILVGHSSVVDEWTTSGTRFSEFGSDATPSPGDIEGVAASPTTGKEYAADSANGQVDIFNAASTVPSTVDLTVTKTHTPEPIAVGSETTFTVNVANANGNDNANNVTVVDTLPSQLTFVAADSDPSCVEAPAQTVTCTISSIAEGSSGSVNIAATGNALASPAVNTVTANADPSETELNPTDNTATDNVNIEPAADLSITEADSADPVTDGDHFTYNIHVANNGPNDADDVTIVDTLPSELTFDSATSDPSCHSAPGNTVSCDIGTLTNGSSDDFAIGVHAVAANPSGTTNQVDVSSGDTADPNLSDNEAFETTTINPSSDLTLTKTEVPNPVQVNQETTFTYTIHNNGPDDANDVVVTEQTPPGALQIDQSNPNTSPDCSITLGGLITCNFGFEPAGNDDSRSVVFTATTDAGTGFASTATVSSDSVDRTAGNSSVTQHLAVFPLADLSVSNTSDNVAHAGDDVTLHISGRNDGPSPATGVVIRDTLPVGLTFNPTGSSPECTVHNDTVTCAIGNMSRFQNAFETIVATTGAQATASSPLTNSAVIDSDDEDPNLGNNTANNLIFVGSAADLSVTLGASPSTVTAGGPITYNADVHNAGPNTAQSVTLTDQLPSGLTYNSAASSSNCSVSGNLVTCSIGNVPSGEDENELIVANTASTSTGAMPNTVSVNHVLFDPAFGNNTATATATIKQPASVAPTVPPLAPSNGNSGFNGGGKKHKKKHKKHKKHKKK